MTAAASLIPDTDQIEIFVEGIFRHASPHGYVSMRSFFDNGSNKVFRIMPVQMESGLKQVITIAGSLAKLAAQCKEPVVACPPCAVFNNPKTAREEDIAEGLELAVECDNNPSRGVMALEQIIGPATFVVASGGKWTDPATGEVEDKLHGHWRLTKPASGTDNIAKLKQARDLATAIIGGDPSNNPICHPIRWPGSWHRKGKPVLCRIVEQRPDNEINLDTALAALQAFAPARKGNGADNAAPQEPGGNDWAEKIREVLSAANYHEALVVLAAKLVSAGVTAAAAEGILRGVMESAAGSRDDRWLSRYNDIPRAVRTAREKFGQEQPEQSPLPQADLREWDAGDDPGPIPPREWLLGNQFCRGYISSVVAAGGAGKSALRLVQLISLAIGRALCGQHVFHRSRVLLVSLEDDEKEINRRIEAVLRHYGVARSELKGWLFCACPRAKLAALQNKTRIVGPLEKMIQDAISRRNPAIVSLDPFIKTHSLTENDVGDMDFVCDLLARFAVEHNLAVDSPHHVHKGQMTPGDADSGRGSSGIRDAGRLVFTLVPMTADEAKLFNINADDRCRYVRLDSAKVNISPPSGSATWFHLVNVPINNGTPQYPAGDHIQVVTPWTPPDAWDGLGNDKLNTILNDIDAGLPDGRRYSADARKERAAWRVVRKHSPEKSEAQCREIIRKWMETELLETRDYTNPVERKKENYLHVNSTKRPGMSAQ